MRILVVSFAALSILAACQRQDLSVVGYRCGDLSVSAVFRGQDRATLAIGERKLELERVPTASGAKYADAAGNEFWTKGLDAALLTLAGEAMRTCVSPAGG